mgnify:CR=1 FL=1
MSLYLRIKETLMPYSLKKDSKIFVQDDRIMVYDSSRLSQMRRSANVPTDRLLKVISSRAPLEIGDFDDLDLKFIDYLIQLGHLEIYEPPSDVAVKLLNNSKDLQIKKILEATGFSVLDSSDAAVNCLEVVVDDGSLEINKINKRNLESSTPWLLVKPFNGVYASVGPLFFSKQTGCYECYERRRLSNIEGITPEVIGIIRDLPPIEVDNPAVNSIISGMVHHIAEQWQTHKDPRLPGKLINIYLEHGELRSRTEHLLRLPRCPVCKDLKPEKTPWGLS